MRILQVADVSIESAISGSERVLYEQSTCLAKRGHEVHLLTRRLPVHKSSKEKIAGVYEWRYTFNRKLPHLFFRSIFFNCRHSFISIQKESFSHIINFHQPFSATGVLSSPAVRGIPLIYTCLSFSFEEYASRTASPTNYNYREWVLFRLHLHSRKLLEKRALRRSDQVVVLSEYTKKKLEKTYSLPPVKIHVIPGGVDLNRFRPRADKQAVRRSLGISDSHLVLLTIRNLEPRMGLENLILAFSRVLEAQTQPALLILGGEGPLAPRLKRLVRQNGMADSVKFTGYIPEEELPSYYRMADLFILPTEELEGFGLVTVEALASGLPVLGTPVGGTKEILAHMGSRFLFADSKPDSMANQILEAIRTWAKDSETYDKISLKCRKVAEDHYSWDAHVDKLEHLFHLAIRQRNSSLRTDP